MSGSKGTIWKAPWLRKVCHFQISGMPLMKKCLINNECKSLCCTLPKKCSGFRDTRRAHLESCHGTVLSAVVKQWGHDQMWNAPRVGMACSSCTDVRVQPAVVHARAAQDLTSIVLHIILGKWYVTVSNVFSTFFRRELYFHLYAVRDCVDTSNLSSSYWKVNSSWHTV